MLTRSAFDTRTERGRRQAERNPMRPAMLLPPGAFSDRPAAEDDFRRLCAPGTPRGRHPRAVQRRLASGCAGWKRRPTAEEFYGAVRAEQPTEVCSSSAPARSTTPPRLAHKPVSRCGERCTTTSPSDRGRHRHGSLPGARGRARLRRCRGYGRASMMAHRWTQSEDTAVRLAAVLDYEDGGRRLRELAPDRAPD